MKFRESVKYEVVVAIPDDLCTCTVNGVAVDAYSQMNKMWIQFATEYFERTDVFVSAISNKGAALYHHSWGCPEYGERVVTFNCTANKEFIKDMDLYEKGIIYITNKFKEALKQHTITITRLKSDVLYMTDSDNKMED